MQFSNAARAAAPERHGCRRRARHGPGKGPFDGPGRGGRVDGNVAQLQQARQERHRRVQGVGIRRALEDQRDDVQDRARVVDRARQEHEVARER